MESSSKEEKSIETYEIQEKLLEIVENHLAGGNHDILEFSDLLKKKMFSLYSKGNINLLVEKLLDQKKIYFIRHAQAMHNKYKNMAKQFEDSELTEEGIQQTESIKELLKSLNIRFEAVFISPLKRTIQTFERISTVFSKDTKFILTDLLREMLTNSRKNIGMPLSKLKEYLKKNNLNVDTSYITKENWFFDESDNKKENFDKILNDKAEHMAESRSLFKLRLRIFILWIILRKEKNILIISHSKVYKYLNKQKISNAKVNEIEKSKLQKRMIKLLYKK